MRRWHRRVMTIFAVTLLYWAGSGVLMALYDATDPTQVWAIEGGGPGARLNDAAAQAAAVPAPAAGIAQALASVPGMAIGSVDYRMTGSIPRLELAEASGERATLRRFYAQSGAPMTALVADGDPDAPQPANVTQRNTLKMWHRGNILGLPGQIVGLLTGLALLVLLITGTLLYLQIWRARRKVRRPAFFWRGRESRWRWLHRWIAIVAAAFVLNITATGVVLAYGELQLRVFLNYHVGAAPYPRPSPLPPVSAGVLPAAVPAMLDTVYRAALPAADGQPLTSLELIVRDGRPKGIATFGGAQPRTLAFDAQSGAPLADWRTSGIQQGNGYFADWHQVLKRLHRGDIIGHFGGRWFQLATGLALLYLVISGLVMYVQTRRRSG